MHPYVIAALFIVVETWKQPKCPSINACTKQMWSICTMEYYSTIRKDEILPFVTTWMNLENIMLNKVSQTEKNQKP